MYLLRSCPSYTAQTLCLLTPRRNLSKGWVAWNGLVLTLVLPYHHCHIKHHWLLMSAIRYQIREMSNSRKNLQVTGSPASISVSFPKQFGHGQPLERNIKKFNYTYWFWVGILPSRPEKRCVFTTTEADLESKCDRQKLRSWTVFIHLVLFQPNQHWYLQYKHTT